MFELTDIANREEYIENCKDMAQDAWENALSYACDNVALAKTYAYDFLRESIDRDQYIVYNKYHMQILQNSPRYGSDLSGTYQGSAEEVIKNMAYDTYCADCQEFLNAIVINAKEDEDDEE